MASLLKRLDKQIASLIKQEAKLLKRLDILNQGGSRLHPRGEELKTERRLEEVRGTKRETYGQMADEQLRKSKTISKTVKKSKRVGGGRAAAALDSRRGGVSKSLLSKKIIPKT
jgi:hypothetical protein